MNFQSACSVTPTIITFKVLLLVLIVLVFIRFYLLITIIICGQATHEEATNMNFILQSFYKASGQTPNLAKSSIMFSKCVDNHSKLAVRNIFPVADLAPNTIYLGQPLIFNHNDRAKAYEFILNKFNAKMTTIKANKLNHAGRLAYINDVLASIPIYYMSTILFFQNLHLQDYYYLSGPFGGLGFKRTTPPLLFILDLGLTFVGPKRRAA
jgi:hypothetical protein